MKNISKFIDHTLLKQQASEQEVIAICDEAIKYDFMSVCINPCHVKLVSKKLSGTDVKTCTVIGFPLGANATAVKVFEAVNAIKEGATEIDMVINVGKVKSNDYDFVENDIKEVVNACKQQNENTIVKVIIETCLLTDTEKEKICTLLLNTKADFVKTSTGFSTGGATISDVTLMKRIVGDNMQIKASGGVRSTEDFHEFVKAGANRIGTSNGVAILENGVIDKDKY